ncbi:MAG: phage tail assembly chaperone [Burkholderiaceae bacterium]
MSDTKASIPAKKLTALNEQVAAFTLPVQITRLDGEPIIIELQCKALRKTEWSKLKDQYFEQLKPAAAPAAEGETPERKTVEAVAAEALKREAALMLKFATGWGLSDPFTAEKLEELEDRFGGAMSAAVAAYDEAIYRGRLGN